MIDLKAVMKAFMEVVKNAPNDKNYWKDLVGEQLPAGPPMTDWIPVPPEMEEACRRAMDDPVYTRDFTSYKIPKEALP